MNTPDITVSFPSSGTVRLESRSLFADPDHLDCRRILERIFQDPHIRSVTITADGRPRAELHYSPRESGFKELTKRVATLLAAGGVQQDGSLQVAPAVTARDFRGVVRYHRHGSAVSGWELISELPGRLRLRNLVLLRRGSLCRTLERELTSVLGVDRFRTSPVTGTLLLWHEPQRISRLQLIEILDAALLRAEPPAAPDRPDTNLPVCTVSVPLAAAAQFAAPALLPAAAVLFVYSSIPTFKEARRVLLEEKRIGVDALDAVVVAGCLGTMSIFPAPSAAGA